MYEKLIEQIRKHIPSNATLLFVKEHDGFLETICEQNGELIRIKIKKQIPKKKPTKYKTKGKFKSEYPIDYFLHVGEFDYQELSVEQFYHLYDSGKFKVRRFYVGEGEYKTTELVLQRFMK